MQNTAFCILGSRWNNRNGDMYHLLFEEEEQVVMDYFLGPRHVTQCLNGHSVRCTIYCQEQSKKGIQTVFSGQLQKPLITDLFIVNNGHDTLNKTNHCRLIETDETEIMYCDGPAPLHHAIGDLLIRVKKKRSAINDIEVSDKCQSGQNKSR